ncbi:MAG: acetyltransferase [Luteitalea sp.]|nr:acetyltransferase [Luteitalea sp.]
MSTRAQIDAAVLAEAVRAACLETAMQAYEDAGMRGLCHEGRWEVVLAALRDLDLRGLTDLAEREPHDPTGQPARGLAR